ncbi:hypothetical protein D3C72_1879830 [compost metagenome]
MADGSGSLIRVSVRVSGPLLANRANSAELRIFSLDRRAASPNSPATANGAATSAQPAQNRAVAIGSWASATDRVPSPISRTPRGRSRSVAANPAVHGLTPVSALVSVDSLWRFSFSSSTFHSALRSAVTG